MIEGRGSAKFFSLASLAPGAGTVIEGRGSKNFPLASLAVGAGIMIEGRGSKFFPLASLAVGAGTILEGRESKPILHTLRPEERHGLKLSVQ